MDFSFWFDIINLEWSIKYIKGPRLYFTSKIVFLSLKTVFVLANSVDPDEMLLYAAFHLVYKAAFHQGLHCLPKYTFMSH